MTAPATLKILIVDDHAGVRRLLAQCLSDLPAECAECADGAAAVATYARLRPDWVTMDLEMPGLDGLTATRRILESFPQARVVIVSQFESPRLREQARQAGACDYLTKENLTGVRELLARQPRLAP